MDWVNDISLVNNSQSIVSASSDQSIKIWSPTPDPYVLNTPHTLGSHTDYAKVLASPNQESTWIASGGLDRKVYIWDLSGKGQVLNIDVTKEAQNKQKASIYALAATNNVLATGSIDSIVRLWDVRSGKRITRFIGHTDVIRSVLLAEDGETVMTASSDSTVKIWSVATGRCEYTLTMHQNSVWSLYSEHPQLKVFWSSDITGLVAKTDARGKAEWDDGTCVAVCQESEAVSKITQAGGYLWAATKLSSVNRWKDVATDEIENIIPEAAIRQRGSVTTITTRPRGISNTVSQYSASFADSPRHNSPAPTSVQNASQISMKNLLRLSATAAFPTYRPKDVETQTLHSSASIRRPTELFDEDLQTGVVVRSSPDFTIEGQHGLIKHTILNNKRQVLTTDTAGEVTLWDLIKVNKIIYTVYKY
jgi:WD repeat-containing protein 48